MKITLISGNERKIHHAKHALAPFGIDVEVKDVDLVEVQGMDPVEIIKTKARDAYKKFKTPLIVSDHSWSIPALGGFPGPYMKHMNKWFEPEDFLALLKDKEDRTAILTERVVYIDGEQEKVFEAEFPAKFIHEPRGKGTFTSERVVMFDGTDKTTAEHIDAGEHPRDMSKTAWAEFGKWYKETPSN